MKRPPLKILIPLLVLTLGLATLAYGYAFRSGSELSATNLGRAIVDHCEDGDLGGLQKRTRVLDHNTLRPPTAKEVELTGICDRVDDTFWVDMHFPTHPILVFNDKPEGRVGTKYCDDAHRLVALLGDPYNPR